MRKGFKNLLKGVNVRGSKRTFKFLNDDDDGVQENSRKEDRKKFFWKGSGWAEDVEQQQRLLTGELKADDDLLVLDIF